MDPAKAETEKDGPIVAVSTICCCARATSCRLNHSISLPFRGIGFPPPARSRATLAGH